MGGKHCCIVGCNNNNEKTKLSQVKISYLGFPKENGVWRRALIAAVGRSDAGFRPDTHHICSVHFEPRCLMFHGSGYKLFPGSLPTLHMPAKSVEIRRPPPHKAPIQRPAPAQLELVAYYNLDDVKKDAQKTTSTGPWTMLASNSSCIVIGLYDDETGTLSRRLIIDNDLKVTLYFEEVIVGRTWGLEKMRLSTCLKEVGVLHRCEGVTDPHYKEMAVAGAYTYINTKVVDGKPVTNTLLRAKQCVGAVQVTGTRCHPCQQLLLTTLVHKQDIHRIHPNTPLSSVPQNVLVNEVKAARIQVKELQTAVRQMQNQMNRVGVSVSQDIGQGLAAALDAHKSDNALMNLFWKEQKKAFSVSASGMRWHPMMIRFAIYLQYQSPRAYEALRETGVLRLPNKSTLRDYTNVIQPQPGFHPHIFEELRKLSDDLPPEKRFVALLHDEMKIKADLVYDKRGGQVIGFTNPDTWVFNNDMTDNIASHVLVFMVTGINSHIKMSIGHFPTKSATADELYPLMWKSIAYLEMTCNLRVLSSTSDKASPNQKLYRMHQVNDMPVVYKAVNPFACDQPRSVYFFSDVPHLVKTIRNNMHKSKAGGTRYLWNNGRNILWSHVQKVYTDDVTRPLYRTKLTYDHVNLTPSSTMSVRLAAQVLSRSVSQVMLHYYAPEMNETAHFLALCDRFFDCLNVRSINEAVFRRKPDLAPYRAIDDQRFQFLRVEFLGYLAKWYQSTQAREGFTKAERNMMFLSYQTYEGLIMTVHAFIEATQFLLQNGAAFVMSQDFCQDPLEEHFGRHRGLGRRHDNPTVSEFGYQENQLRIQRSLAFALNPKGNTAGKKGEKRPVNIINSPLKKLRH